FASERPQIATGSCAEIHRWTGKSGAIKRKEALTTVTIRANICRIRRVVYNIYVRRFTRDVQTEAFKDGHRTRPRFATGAADYQPRHRSADRERPLDRAAAERDAGAGGVRRTQSEGS